MSRIIASALFVSLAACGPQTVMTRAGALEVEPTSVDFGTVAPGSTREGTLTLRNVGGRPVTLTRAAFDGDAAGDFSLTPTALSTVAPADEGVLVVRFDARAERSRVARLILETDSSITPVLIIPVTAFVGTCSCPAPMACMQLATCASCTYEPIPGCVVDAGLVDAGSDDAGLADAGEDSGVVDAGPEDAGAIDAEADDAGTIDAGPLDSGTPDAGAADAGPPVPFDASVPFYTPELMHASNTHACAVVADGGVKCWGRNEYFQLGTLTTTEVVGAASVQQLQGRAVGVSTGQFHSCALLEDGRMSCWGTTDAVLPPSESPVIIPLDAGVVGMSGSLFIGCAITGPSREVSCWGNNYNGAAVGNGTTTGTVSVPTRIPLVAGAAKLAGGTYHQCALLLNGQIYCWGENGRGELGNGLTADAPSPVRVLLDAGAVDLSVSSDVSCALKANQRISCWGYNGAVTIHADAGAVAAIRVPVDHWAFPQPVRGMSNGSNAVYGLELDGGLSCFSPTPGACSRTSGGPGVGSLDVGANPRLVRAGLSAGCALQRDAGTVCWGLNAFGVPGTGIDAGYTTTPIRPLGL
jgi:hypothetical protein